MTEAAEAVGYVPNAAARSLRSRRTGQIAFAMPDVANPVYTSMVGSIQDVARETRRPADAALDRAPTPRTSSRSVRDLKQRFVDGLILFSLHFTEAHAARARAGGGAGGRDRHARRRARRVDTVRPNSRRGAAEAVRHLHAVGRRRIAFVNGPQHTVPGAARRLGYLDGLRACGLERDDALSSSPTTSWSSPAGAPPSGCSRARGPTRSSARTTCSPSARSPRCALPHFASRSDVAVVGMDNTALSELTWPPLTTIDLGSAERARIAAELLFDRIEDPARAPQTVSVEPRLVVRASSGAG